MVEDIGFSFLELVQETIQFYKKMNDGQSGEGDNLLDAKIFQETEEDFWVFS